MSSWLNLPELLDQDIEAVPSTTISSPDRTPMQGLGVLLAVTGALTSGIGSFFSAKSQKAELEASALSKQFEATESARTARRAENEAQSIQQSAHHEIAAVTARAGAQKAAFRAARGASGVRIGVGSAAEADASIDLVKEVDVLTVSSNAARAAAATRLQGVNAANNSSLAAVSARNLRGTAKSISPLSEGATSLLTSATRIGAQWVTDTYDRRKN